MTDPIDYDALVRDFETLSPGYRIKGVSDVCGECYAVPITVFSGE